jgi:hypothetical protein
MITEFLNKDVQQCLQWKEVKRGPPSEETLRSTYALLTCQIYTKVGQRPDLKQLILIDRPDSTRQNQGRLYELFVRYKSLETIWDRFEMFAVEQEPPSSVRIRLLSGHAELTLYLGF